jgi:hypothetical protein
MWPAYSLVRRSKACSDLQDGHSTAWHSTGARWSARLVTVPC